MYLLTPSLINAWDWALSSGDLDGFLSVLRREPSVTTDAIEMGFGFEEWAYANLPEFQDAAKQVKVSRVLGDYLIYGRLDGLKAGDVLDAKYTGNYEAGKYYNANQTPFYLFLVPEAKRMVYIIGTKKGADDEEYQLYSEVYDREDITVSVDAIVKLFESWLKRHGLWDLYVQFWTTEGRHGDS